MTRMIVKIIMIGTVLLATLLAHAEDLNVAAASDLSFAMKELAANYEKQTGTVVKVTLGSSGNFFTPDSERRALRPVLRDIDYPKKLEAAGLGEPGTLYQYATGKIVLWCRPARSSM